MSAEASLSLYITSKNIGTFNFFSKTVSSPLLTVHLRISRKCLSVEHFKLLGRIIYQEDKNHFGRVINKVRKVLCGWVGYRSYRKWIGGCGHFTGHDLPTSFPRMQKIHKVLVPNRGNDTGYGGWHTVSLIKCFGENLLFASACR